MEIEINAQTTLFDIKKAFKAEFPFLDLAFFSEPHNEGNANAKRSQLNPDYLAGSAGDAHRIGLLQITGDQTAGFTEKELETGFGLHAQVLRKSGNVWLQTTRSDGTTLSELNAAAEAHEKDKGDDIEPVDYHEQE